MEGHLKKLANVFKALSDQNRLKIVKMLASNTDDTLCVSDVAKKLGISQPAASQHIKILKNLGVLGENKIGFRVYYTIEMEALFHFKNEIDELFNKAFEQCPHDYKCSECEFDKKC